MSLTDEEVKLLQAKLTSGAIEKLLQTIESNPVIALFFAMAIVGYAAAVVEAFEEMKARTEAAKNHVDL